MVHRIAVFMFPPRIKQPKLLHYRALRPRAKANNVLHGMEHKYIIITCPYIILEQWKELVRIDKNIA